MGVAVFGVPVLMILSSLTVTSEYRTGLIRTTFMAVPNRTLVLVAKAVVAAVFSGVYTAVMVIASVAVARASLSDPQVWRLVGAIALYAMLAAVLGVGVGALLRASAGAVALLLLWPLVAEPMLANLPNISSAVGPYLPFVNAFIFIRVQWLYPYHAMPWGELGSIVYFAAVVAAVFVAALVSVNRRDA